MNKVKLRYIIENPHNFSAAAIGRELKVDHTTILYWQAKLASRGFKVNKGQNQNQAGIDSVLNEIWQELNNEASA